MRHRLLTNDAVTAREAAAVCHQLNLPGGQEGSGFTAALVALMARADPDDLARLAQGFPGHAAAVRLAHSGTDGAELLSAVARGEVAAVELSREDVCLQVVALLAEAEERLRTCPVGRPSAAGPAAGTDNIAEARALVSVARSAVLRAAGMTPVDSETPGQGPG